ncbi:MAG: hypothetical protein HXS41_13955 [Theionarchaea archaeon]|nr:hypothetical protein [Theionarchaea archaeon]MBU7022154.1 hypothetical protein [Theionarchaea archaeon]MBU7040177.1 hypothetical protein [Theionarchaea archaeon]
MKKRKQYGFRNLQRIAVAILLAAVVVATWTRVEAQSSTDVVWTGDAGDGKWETPGNWSTNRVPDASSNVRISNGGNITVGRPVMINSLIMGAGYSNLLGTESSRSIIIRACENIRIDDGNLIRGYDSSMGKDGGSVEICSERGCIENGGEIFGGMGKENTKGGSVTIFATHGYISNSGYIQGNIGGENEHGGNVEIIARGSITNSHMISGGYGGLNGDGGGVRIISGGNITNSSTIDGGNARSGGSGGSIVIEANYNVMNTGEIHGGKCEKNGPGGSVDIRAHGNITHDGVISEGVVESEVRKLLTKDMRTNTDYGVVISANRVVTIGNNAKISASRIVSISAGNSVSMEWHLGGAITATKDVYIRVSREGTINLREIRKGTAVISTPGNLYMSAVPLKSKGVELTDIIEATDIITSIPPYEPSTEPFPDPEECMLCSESTYRDPPIWGNFMAFPGTEEPNSNLRSSGKSDSIVLCYKNLRTGEVSKTDLLVSDSFHAIDIYQNIIAFVAPDSYVLYLDLDTGKVEKTGATGHHPSVYGNFITFASEGRILYFDLTTRILSDTHISGDRPSIWKDTIVFHAAPGPTIQIYDLSTKTVSPTPVIGMNANICETIIVFETPESLVSECLNNDGDTDDVVIRYYDLESQKISDTGAAGFYPVVYGDIIAFTVSEQDAEKDLNGDGQILGNVIHYYNIRTGAVVSTGKLGTEPDIFDGTITYYVWERWMGTDLNEDGDVDDSVLETFEIPAGGMAVQDQEIWSFLAILFICTLFLIVWRKR